MKLRNLLIAGAVAVSSIASAQSPLYIFGSFNGWNPGASTEMSYSGGVYSVDNIEFGAGGNFAVSTVKSSNWDEVNANRYGFEVDNSMASNGVAMPIVKGQGAMQVPSAGVYSIDVNLSAMTVTVTRTETVKIDTPDELYLFGTLAGSSWEPQNGVAMSKSGDLFTVDVNLVADDSGAAYFAMSELLSPDWSEVNEYRFAPVAGEVAFELNSPVEFAKGEAAFKVNVGVSGKYTVAADFATLKVSVTKASGIEDVFASDACHAPVYYNLQGVEVKNPVNGLYIVKCGDKVAKKLF